MTPVLAVAMQSIPAKANEWVHAPTHSFFVDKDGRVTKEAIQQESGLWAAIHHLGDSAKFADRERAIVWLERA